MKLMKRDIISYSKDDMSYVFICSSIKIFPFQKGLTGCIETKALV